MGLTDTFKTAAQTAFTAVGDIVESVTFRSKTSASAAYDPVTGTVTDAYTDYTVDMIITPIKVLQNDNRAILENDCEAMIPVENLTPTPKVHDQIIRDTTQIWDIVWFKTDAAQALWTFQIRQL